MDIKISSRNIKIGEKLEEYTRRKVDRLDRYLPNIQDVRVDLARQHNSRGEDVSIAQITIKHARGAILRAEEKTAGEIQFAIDSAVDKMYRQIERFKGKRRDKKRKRDKYIATVEELEIAEPLPIEEAYEEVHVGDGLPGEEDQTSVLRRKIVELIPMDEEEAIQQMELLGHTFFMFFNAESGKVNVVYRRAEHGYGLLEPENA